MVSIKNYDFYYQLRTLPFVREILLFGSRAKGLEQERSDIDLAIFCPKATDEEWQTIRTIVDAADTLLKIDCIRLDTLQDERLRREIDDSKVVLFQRVENSYVWYDLFLDLGEALDKFKDVLEIDKEKFTYVVEATIQVFEYTFELYWKALKKICLDEGIEVNSPRSTLQQAYAMKLIDSEKSWLEMMENRNLTSHTYKQPTALLIYENCKTYCPLMRANYTKLKERYNL